MRIGSNNGNRLESLLFSQSEELREASELLYELLNASYLCSGNCLETEVHDHWTNIQQLYRECKENMEAAAMGGEKAEFLLMSIMEDTFKKALPLLLVRVEDLVNGNFRQVEAAKRLQELFRDNAYAKLWKQKSEQYRDMLKSMGFDVKTDDYRDLTAIMEPLLDALTLYLPTRHRWAPKIYLIREGKRSNARPIIITDMCKWGSEKELVDAVSGYPKECVIAFGAVEKTNRQVKDYFYEWQHGYPEERQRNYMYHDHLTAEEYLEQIANYTRGVWLCVKCGQAVYLMEMPHHTDTYADLTNPESLYNYGERAGYAPYAIFFKDTPPAEQDSMLPTVRQKGYHLSELMDDMQKVWLPVFLNETIERFFLEEPKAERLYLPEEATVVIHKTDGKTTELIPTGNALPVLRSWVYEVSGPEEMFGDKPYMLTLIRHFGITQDMLDDVPIFLYQSGDDNALNKAAEKMVRQAYIKLLADRINDYLAGAYVIHSEIVDFIFKNDIGKIAQAAAEGVFDAFSKIVIDGALVLDKDGNPVMGQNPKAARWRPEIPEKIPQKMHTSADDCRDYNSDYLKRYTFAKAFWVGQPSASKPPVIVKIRPRTSDDYKTMYHVVGMDMPDFFDLLDEIMQFCRETNTPPYYHNSDSGRGLTANCLMDINLCMRKTVLKQWKK